MIRLETVTETNLESEAEDIQTLVKVNKRWLKRVRPETYTRYRNASKAVESLTRAVSATEHISFPFRRDRVAVALGTIVHDISFLHAAENKKFEGRLIDYWASDEVTDAEHIEIATQLSRHGDYKGRVLALLTAAETERAKGIPLAMERIGEPTHVEIPRTEDTFGLSAVPDLQLYQLVVS